MAKYLAEVGDYIKLGISGDGGSIHHYTCQDIHGMDYLVFWGDIMLVEIGVPKLYGIIELIMLVFLCDYQ